MGQVLSSGYAVRINNPKFVDSYQILQHNIESSPTINRYSSEGQKFDHLPQVSDKKEKKRMKLSKLLRVEHRVNEAKILNAYS